MTPIETLRTRLQISHRDFARILDVTPNALKYANRQGKCSKRIALHIADLYPQQLQLLGITVEHLLRGKMPSETNGRRRRKRAA